MAKIECSNEQLRLIQDALELYSRIGIMQIDHILYHPSVDRLLHDQFTPKKDKLEVGDDTIRGEIVEIGKKSIKTKGYWSDRKERLGLPDSDTSNMVEEVREWFDVENVKLSCDYGLYHATCDTIKNYCSTIKNLITGDPQIASPNASYGIGRTKEGQQNIDAYDMIQTIRHVFWKANPKRSNMTVDSSVCKFGNKDLIKVELDEKL